MYPCLSLTFLSCIDTQGFRQFLRLAWEPFEIQFQLIEARFIHHSDTVVGLLGDDENQTYFHRKEQDKQRQEGKCDCLRANID